MPAFMMFAKWDAEETIELDEDDVDEDEDEAIDEVGEEFERLLVVVLLLLIFTEEEVLSIIFSVLVLCLTCLVSASSPKLFDKFEELLLLEVDFMLEDAGKLISDDETTTDAAPTNDVTAFDMFYLNRNRKNVTIMNKFY